MVDRAVSRDPVVKFMLERLDEVRCNALWHARLQ